MSNISSIAIIGAGPSGIGVAKQLLTNSNFKVVVFERQDKAGGLWIGDLSETKDLHDMHVSPVHNEMRTNIPKQTMCYPDFPYSEETPTFPHHTHVQEYVAQYAEVSQITEKIRFNTEVIQVSPITNQRLPNQRFIKWKIQSKNSDVIKTEEFDAVVLCSGIFSWPEIPSIDGIENFKGDIVHSKWYAGSQYYTNKNIVIVGFGLSAANILIHLSKVCKKIYISRRKEFYKGNHPSNVIHVPLISTINKNGDIVFENGETVEVDSIILCTGYVYKYPYLSDSSGISVVENGKVVFPLYKHTFNLKYPSMAIVTLRQGGPAFALIYYQSIYVEKVFSGELRLPSYENMMQEITSTLDTFKKDDQKHFHQVGTNHYEFIDELARITGTEELPKIVKDMYNKNVAERQLDIYNYKSNKFKVIDLHNYEFIKFDHESEEMKRLNLERN